MQLQLALVCDDAGTSAEGKLDIHGVFNDLYAPGFPAQQDRMVLVLAVEWGHADQGRYQFRVDLVGPQDQPVLTVDGYTDVDPRPLDRPPPRTRLILPLEGVVFEEPGRYAFRIRLKGTDHPGPALYLIQSEPEPA
jgi:hypothetical protein